MYTGYYPISYLYSPFPFSHSPSLVPILYFLFLYFVYFTLFFCLPFSLFHPSLPFSVFSLLVYRCSLFSRSNRQSLFRAPGLHFPFIILFFLFSIFHFRFLFPVTVPRSSIPFSVPTFSRCPIACFPLFPFPRLPFPCFLVPGSRFPFPNFPSPRSQCMLYRSLSVPFRYRAWFWLHPKNGS